ncbi:MAG: Fpg/Nei family DNA glycosylase, partial [Actinomycetota bacterium]|nr:Fpg/Nei family DNA glycosylase [Actinomycetota bacterium]
MPEGHTLYRLAADLSAAFSGQRVEVTSPQGRFSDAALVDGHVVEIAESAGKHLFIRFETGPIVHVHLGLIGAFGIEEGEPPPAVGAVRLRIVAPAAYADLR